MHLKKWKPGKVGVSHVAEEQIHTKEPVKLADFSVRVRVTRFSVCIHRRPRMNMRVNCASHKQTRLKPRQVEEKSGFWSRQADQCKEASQLPVKEMCFMKLREVSKNVLP